MAAIRTATAGDAAAIAEVYNQGISERASTFETEPRSAADVRAWLEAGERLPVLVAEDGAVLGWARVLAYSSRAAYAGVGEASVYVDRRARGRGIGSRLLGELSRRAALLGYWKLTGKLFPENESRVRLVHRCGWREVGLHLRHGRLEDRWRDVLVVERLLAAEVPMLRGGGSPIAG